MRTLSRCVLDCLCLCTLQGKSVDSICLFQIMSVMSFLTLLPIAIFFEGTPGLPSTLAARVSVEPVTQALQTFM